MNGPTVAFDQTQLVQTHIHAPPPTTLGKLSSHTSISNPSIPRRSRVSTTFSTRNATARKFLHQINVERAIDASTRDGTAAGDLEDDLAADEHPSPPKSPITVVTLDSPPLLSPAPYMSPRFPMTNRDSSLVRLMPHRYTATRKIWTAVSSAERRQMRIVTPGPGEWYSIALSRPPHHSVRVNISLRSDGLLLSPRTIRFTPRDWERPRHVYVRARPAFDELRANTSVVKIWHYVVSNDDDFNNFGLRPLSVHCFKATGPSLVSFGSDSNGQLGRSRGDDAQHNKLDDFHQVSLPRCLSTTYLNVLNELTGLGLQNQEHSGSEQQPAPPPPQQREAIGARHASKLSQRTSPEDDEEEVSSGRTRRKKQREREMTDVDPDGSLGGFLSSDSELAPNDQAFERYVSIRLKHRHDEHVAGKQGDYDKVLGMAAGTRFSVFFCYDGNVYSFGLNNKGQLGVGDTRDRKTPTQAAFERSDDEVEKGPMFQAAKPHALFSERVVVVSVACGSEHCAAISANGCCFAWGDNSYGQLGLGDTRHRYKPERVRGGGLELVLVTQCSCGMFHTVVAGRLEQGGTPVVYAWGHKLNGALGVAPRGRSFLDDDQCELWPIEVTLRRGLETLQISCGNFHSALVDIHGELYTCGLSDSGQLGRDCEEAPSNLYGRVRLPRRTELGGERVKATQVSCGGMHTIVLASSHEVFAFGNNQLGQLGLGDTRVRRAPSKIDVLGPFALAKPSIVVSGVAAGHAYSAAWTENGLAFVWGEATCGQLGTATEHIYTNHTVPCPSVLPELSYARCRAITFGGTHTLALTDVKLVAVKKLIATSRDLYRDASLHFRMAAFLSGACGQRTYRNERKLWTRRRKIFKVITVVDYATIANRRVQAKLYKAVRNAKLTKVLRVDPRSSRHAESRAAVYRSARHSLRVAARLTPADRAIVQALLQQHWLSCARCRGYRPHDEQQPALLLRKSPYAHGALRASVPLLLNFLGALNARVLRSTCVALRAAYDYELLEHIELALWCRKHLSSIISRFRHRRSVCTSPMSSGSSQRPKSTLLTVLRQARSKTTRQSQIIQHLRRPSLVSVSKQDEADTSDDNPAQVTVRTRRRRKCKTTTAPAVPAARKRPKRPASAPPLRLNPPPPPVPDLTPQPPPASSSARRYRADRGFTAVYSNKKKKAPRQRKTFIPVRQERRHWRQSNGALSMEQLQQVLLHVSRIKEIVQQHPVRNSQFPMPCTTKLTDDDTMSLLSSVSSTTFAAVSVRQRTPKRPTSARAAYHRPTSDTSSSRSRRSSSIDNPSSLPCYPRARVFSEEAPSVRFAI